MKKAWNPMMMVRPGGHQPGEIGAGGLGDAQAGADQQGVGEGDRGRADHAHFDGDGREDHVTGDLGDDLGRLEESQPRASEATRSHVEPTVAELLAVVGVVVRRPRIEPFVHPEMDLAEEVGGKDGADGKEHEPEDQVADPAGGDPEQADEEGEEQGGEADVVLHADDHHGDAPGHQNGDERSRVEHEPVAQAGRGDRQQLLVGREVGGEEDAEEELGEFDRVGIRSRRSGSRAGRH